MFAGVYILSFKNLFCLLTIGIFPILFDPVTDPRIPTTVKYFSKRLIKILIDTPSSYLYSIIGNYNCRPLRHCQNGILSYAKWSMDELHIPQY